MASRLVIVGLWVGFALALVLAGAMFLFACGTRFSFRHFCAVPVTEFSQLKSRNVALGLERNRQVEQLRRSQQCRAQEPEPAPPAPDSAAVEETPAQTAQSEQATVQCQPPATDENLVLVDVSLSMRADYMLPPALAAQIEQANKALQENSAFLLRALLNKRLEQLYQQLDTPAKPDRIDVARSALLPLLSGLAPEGRIELMSFAECGMPLRREGVFGPGDGADYERAVNGLQLRPSTPLAQAIDQLPSQTDAGRSPDRPVNIVIIADGEDNCGGDPCAAAARLHTHLPHANVSVVAIADSAAATACIAERTNGRFLTAANADELKLRLRQTAGQLDSAECGALDDAPVGTAPIRPERQRNIP